MKFVGWALGARTAVAAAVAWLVCACCLGCSPAAMAALAGCCAAVGAGCLVVRSSVAQGVAICASCVAVVLLPLAAREHSDRSSPLSALARHAATVDLELVTTGDPVMLAARGVAGTPRVSVRARAAELVQRADRYAVGGRVLVIAPAEGWADVVPGQRVRVSAELAPALAPGPAGVVAFVRGAPSLIGAPPWWQRAAAHIRASLRMASAGLPASSRGLLPGLVDGDTSKLDPVVKAHFRVAGMTHLVAVSGTNCSILVGAVLLALRRTRLRPWQRAALAAVVVVAFVVVARPSPSVLRAAVMAAIALAALATGRRRHGISALGTAVIVLLVFDPLLARDIGFTMSVLATAALLTLAPVLAAALQQRKVPLFVAGPVAVAASAHLVTAPVVAAFSGRFSIVAIPANVLAEPVVAVTTVLGFLAAVLAPVWLPAGAFFAQLAGWPCRWLILIADRFGGMQGATVPWAGGTQGVVWLTAVLIVVLVLVIRYRRLRRTLAAAVLVAVVIQLPVRSVVASWPPSGWFFVACDVGQGDGLVLNAGAAGAVVIDAGPDAVVMDRCLHDLGVHHVALLVFSHLHLDHVGGIDGVLRNRRVDHVATGPLDEPASGLHIVEHALLAHGLQLGLLVPGTTADIGPDHLEMIAPRSAFHGTRSDPNNSSVVLRATVNGVRVLLCGDVEVEAQQAMLDDHVDVSADILKVPHHGSAHSLAGFLAAVGASSAVISVGLHNDYGHPAPSLLAMLAQLGVPTRRTDRDGDVAFAGTPGHITSIVRGTSASTLASGRTRARAPPHQRWLPSFAPTH